MTPRLLLTLNAGSSSIKVGLFSLDDGRAEAIGRGALNLQHDAPTLALQLPDGRHEVALAAAPDDDAQGLVEELLAALDAQGNLGKLHAVGHRVVHGGMRFHAAVGIDDATLAEITALIPLAPLHQPHSLRLIEALRRLRPELRQTASFDTAFHATQSDLVRRFALPRELHDAGIRRYGFHGLSYAFIAGELERSHPALAAGRVVVAHLGNGASLCALHGGRSVDTSMGFSTLDGVPMGTRCGALDPGVVLHLLQARGMSAAQVEDLLYRRAGLLGVSGTSADMRVLRASEAPEAREALDMFALRCAGEVARLAATLQGLDTLVFTAGIGEHDAAMRAAICERLGWLGVEVDAAANARHAGSIAAPASRVAVLVLPTDEEQVIADDALALIGAAG